MHSLKSTRNTKIGSYTVFPIGIVEVIDIWLYKERKIDIKRNRSSHC